MSGGVDSSVVAKMMVDEGHEVVGLFLKLWSSPDCGIKRDNRCCDYEALEDARAVANQLNIPFYVINAEKEFKKEVVDYFLNEYKNLRTPNPCIVCNDKIKFDLLLKKALQLGCEKLVSGHYSRIIDSGNSRSEILNSKKITNSKAQDQNNPVIPAKAGIQELINTGSQIESGMTFGGYGLFAGVDELKDQSYMLYRLDQAQLSKVLFPLGEMTKKEVRTLARKWNLPVKEKPESQEICFVAEKDYREFLKRYLPKKYFSPGDIVDQNGGIVGRHEGLVNYTVGQRKGIEQQKSQVPSPESKGNSKSKNQNEDRKPLYVVGFDVEKNRLIVGEDKETFKKEMVVKDVHWIVQSPKVLKSKSQKEISSGLPDSWTHDLSVKIRYRHPGVEISKIKYQISNKAQIPNSQTTTQQWNRVIIEFEKPQRAVTSGQSAVFYSGDEVLGGGIIVE